MSLTFIQRDGTIPLPSAGFPFEFFSSPYKQEIYQSIGKLIWYPVVPEDAVYSWVEQIQLDAKDPNLSPWTENCDMIRCEN